MTRVTTLLVLVLGAMSAFGPLATDMYLPAFPRIAADLGLGIDIEPVGHFDPVAFDPGLVQTVRAAAERLGYSHMNIVSGAGHDACWINRVAPTVMIMCPCVDGLSHNEAEEITPEWASAGADVLLHAVLDAAEVVG